MKAVHIHQDVERDGEIRLTGLPYRRGEAVDLIVVLPSAEEEAPKAGGRVLRAGDLCRSRLVGLWAARRDMGDTAMFARRLRAQAQTQRLRR
jgi:hypothetical protein